MKFSREFLKKFAESADILNTLHGGTVNPIIQYSESRYELVINVRIPGIDMNKVRVEVHNNVLSVVHDMEFKSNLLPVKVPNVVYRRVLPYYVNFNGIKAVNEESDIYIHLPYNELGNGFHKKINIERDN